VGVRGVERGIILRFVPLINMVKVVKSRRLRRTLVQRRFEGQTMLIEL
jgi:hypothetical protein